MPDIDAGNKKPPENGLFGDGGEAARGPGRPKGATNKRWQHWQQLAATMRVHPVVFLLQTAATDERELAERLELVERNEDGSVRVGADGRPVLQAQALVQAHTMRREAAKDVLPYVEQKAPTAVEDVSEGGPGRMVVVVGQMTPAQQGQVQQRFGWALRPQQNQQVIDAQFAQSDAQQSDDAPKALTTKQE